MSNPDAETIILKILTGVQAGIDIALSDGEYTLGSGDDDDIQIYDVSLEPSHIRLRVAGGKVMAAGGRGALRTSTGVVLDAGSEFQEIEALDGVFAGTTRFTTGRVSANWASLNEIAADIAADGKRPSPPGGASGLFSRRLLGIGLPLALLVLAIGVFLLSLSGTTPGAATRETADDRLRLVREAVEGFAFGRGIQVSRDVDNVTYVSGFVEKPVERRAVVTAVRDIDPAARIRLTALETTREEIASLLAASDRGIDFTLDSAGTLTLNGVMLDPAEAAATEALLRDGVAGLTAIVSNIRTAPGLLNEVTDLARRSQIEPFVLFRLDGTLIEASGVLATEKIDAWAGFLQAYSSQFSRHIALRSLVSLQNADGSSGRSSRSLVLGSAGLSPGDVPLDIDRLSQGNFKLDDIFVNPPADAKAESPADEAGAEHEVPYLAVDGRAGVAASSRRDGRSPQSRDTVQDVLQGWRDDLSPEAGGALDGSDTGEVVLSAATAGERHTPSFSSVPADEQGHAGAAREGEAGLPSSGGAASSRNTVAVRSLLQDWRDDRLPETDEGRAIRSALDRLDAGRNLFPGGTMDERYAPLSSSEAVPALQACWGGSRIPVADLPGLVFWLDVLSVSNDLTLANLDADIRGAVLEAALDPERVAQCLDRIGRGALVSRYYREVERNPGFVRFIARNLAPYALDIAGVNLSADRYIQTRDGNKLHRGSAPDRNSRIASIGELGVMIEKEGRLSAVIFGPEINWLVR